MTDQIGAADWGDAYTTYVEAEQERRWAEAADRYYADLEAGVAPWRDDDQ